jgi:hypothetical protein
MKSDNEIIQAGFDSIFSNLGMVEAERRTLYYADKTRQI